MSYGNSKLKKILKQQWAPWCSGCEFTLRPQPPPHSAPAPNLLQQGPKINPELGAILRAGRQRLHPGRAGVWLCFESRNLQVALQKGVLHVVFLQRILLGHPKMLKSRYCPTTAGQSCPKILQKTVPIPFVQDPETPDTTTLLGSSPKDLPQSCHRTSPQKPLWFGVGRREERTGRRD